MVRNINGKKTWKCCCSGCLRIAQEGKDGIYILDISLDKCFGFCWVLVLFLNKTTVTYFQVCPDSVFVYYVN